jgi:hypothetical protein
MSSTNRGYERHKADYYVTPQKCIREFLSYFLEDENIERPDRINWLDPCAGGSEDDEMSYPTVIEKEFGASVCSLDIREDSKADIIMDFLTADKENFLKHEIIITNPPFDIAEGIINKALEIAPEGGYVIMLLRLNFFGSALRKPFFEKNMPIRCYVHHKRISFITAKMNAKRKAEGLKPLTADSIEYAHFVWKKGTNPKETLLTVI